MSSLSVCQQPGGCKTRTRRDDSSRGVAAHRLWVGRTEEGRGGGEGGRERGEEGGELRTMPVFERTTARFIVGAFGFHSSEGTVLLTCRKLTYICERVEWGERGVVTDEINRTKQKPRGEYCRKPAEIPDVNRIRVVRARDKCIPCIGLDRLRLTPPPPPPRNCTRPSRRPPAAKVRSQDSWISACTCV